MAKRKKTRRKNGFTIPIMPIAGALPGLMYGYKRGKEYGFEEGVRSMVGAYTGYHQYADGTGVWQFQNLMRGAVPLVIGVVAHKAMGKLGVNRALAAAKVPLLRF